MFTAKYVFVLSNFVKAETGRILNIKFPYFKIIRHFTSEWTNTKYVSTFEKYRIIRFTLVSMFKDSLTLDK